jgi:hypothetical protein
LCAQHFQVCEWQIRLFSRFVEIENQPKPSRRGHFWSLRRTLLLLAPDNQKFVNDLGWCLLSAGRVEDAHRMLERAASMDPSDELARENLRISEEKQKKSLPSVFEEESAVARTAKSITADDLRGLPGLTRAACNDLLARQPATVRQALRIHGIGRKTTRILLALGLIIDPDGIQSRPRTLEEIRGK